MKILRFSTDEQILLELAERVKAARIRSGFTQEKLSKESGVAKSTVERLEKGESVQFLNLIKILRTLNLLENLELLIPSAEQTPVEYAKTKYKAKRQRYRATEMVADSGFKWGDEK